MVVVREAEFQRGITIAEDLDVTGNAQVGLDLVVTGSISSSNLLYEKIYGGTQSAPGGGNYKITFMEIGGVVIAQLKKADFAFTAASTAPAGFSPSGSLPDLYKPSIDIDVPCWMKNNGTVSMGIIRLENSGQVLMGPSLSAGGFGSFDSGTACGPYGDVSFSYIGSTITQISN